ncbi:MAG: methyltransferase domain-containing protein [Cyanobacteria bacterium J06641_5]
MHTPLQQDIQQFYDDSSRLWEETWGEHMHHGYYGRNGTHKLPRHQAQVALMEELLRFAGLAEPLEPSARSPQRILDAGCGIGGSTLFLANRFGATAVGLTLSPVQAARARERAATAGLGDLVRFEVADAQETDLAENSVDLVWSLESGEHMPDKAAFLEECYRVLKPGGKLIFATWCHRPTASLAGPLTADERAHLQQIYDVYYLPYVLSLPRYGEIARSCGFEQLRLEDWSAAVAPFWDETIASAIDPAVLLGILRSGVKTVRGALALGLMRSGYQRGLVRFGVLCGIKPI